MLFQTYSKRLFGSCAICFICKAYLYLLYIGYFLYIQIILVRVSSYTLHCSIFSHVLCPEVLWGNTHSGCEGAQPRSAGTYWWNPEIPSENPQAFCWAISQLRSSDARCVLQASPSWCWQQDPAWQFLHRHLLATATRPLRTGSHSPASATACEIQHRPVWSSNFSYWNSTVPPRFNS